MWHYVIPSIVLVLSLIVAVVAFYIALIDAQFSRTALVVTGIALFVFAFSLLSLFGRSINN